MMKAFHKKFLEDGTMNEVLGAPCTILKLEILGVEYVSGITVGTNYEAFAIVKNHDGSLEVVNGRNLIVKE